MRIFVTGATGFIGSAIVQELLGAGHQVLGLARTEAGAAAVAAAGAQPQRGALEDADCLRRGAAESDGVIHTAYNHDFVNVSREVAAEADKRTIELFGAVLAGSGRPLVVTSGMGIPAHRGVYTEDDAPDPAAGNPHRIICERAAIALAAQGVRSSVIRLPPSVHGDGDRAFVPALIQLARDKRVSAYIGDGRNRWPAVHRLDAARLFRLAAERGAAGSTFHGIGDHGIPTRDIAEAIGRRLHVPVATKASAEAAAHFGWLGAFFALDLPGSAARTQQQLGWQPSHPGLIEDLEHGRYFDA